MPNPNLKRNLKPGKGGTREGAGRPRADDPGRKFWIKMLKRPAFIKALEAKMDDCTIHPSVLVAGFYYAHGKPRETIEVKQIVPVKIVHQYTDEVPYLPGSADSDINPFTTVRQLATESVHVLSPLVPTKES